MDRAKIAAWARRLKDEVQAELEWRAGLNECVSAYLDIYTTERKAAGEDGFKFTMTDERRWRKRFDQLRTETDVGMQIEIAARNAEEIAARLAALRLERIARGAGRNRERGNA